MTFDVILLLWYFSVVSSQTQSQTFSVAEDTPIGTLIGKIETADIQAPFTHILPHEAQNLFAVNLDTGAIMIKRMLDREDKDIHTFIVVSIDNKQLQVDVKVLDTNDNAPMFSQLVYNVTVGEDTPTNTTVIVVRATDRDSGLIETIRYFISSPAAFHIDSMTGVIRLRGYLDNETRQYFSFLVGATDGVHIGFATVNVDVTDHNERK